jgi:putative peptide zinc metalloprotease protein
LFNGNFLMRFDGYYILTDLLEVQNLYTTGQQYLRYLVRRYLLDLPASLPQAVTGHKALIRVYAFASFAWRVLFYAGIVLVAATMFHGAGVVLALLGILLWFVKPAVGFAKYLVLARDEERPNRRRFVWVTGLATTVLIGFLCLPWPGGAGAYGVVDYEPLALLRVDSPGFVRRILVPSGAEVEQGELIATIDNPTTVLELADIDLAIEQSNTKARALHQDADVASCQVERRHRESLEEQRTELADKVKQLEIRSPGDGFVLGRDLPTRLGQYVRSGETLAAVGRERHKQIVLSVSQRDVDFFLRQIGSRPHVRIKGRLTPLADAQLTEVHPRATRRLQHPALAAIHGGPLSVSMASREQAESDPASPELVEPYFEAIVSLPEEVALRLRAGELAHVRVAAAGETIGEHLYGIVRRWVLAKLKIAPSSN